MTAPTGGTTGRGTGRSAQKPDTRRWTDALAVARQMLEERCDTPITRAWDAGDRWVFQVQSHGTRPGEVPPGRWARSAYRKLMKGSPYLDILDDSEPVPLCDRKARDWPEMPLD